MKHFVGMNRAIFAAVSLLATLASCQSSKVKITGRFVGSQADMVYLEQVGTLEHSVIDSIKLSEDGGFALKIDNGTTTPTLYNVIYDNERIPLLLKAGDRVTLRAAGSVLRNYTVEGALESELLREFNKSYIEGAIKLNDAVSRYTAADIDEKQREEIAREYTQIYRDIKRNQLRFIVEHKDRIAAVYALRQRLPNDAYLFNGDSDVIYYRTVAEAIEKSYPSSPYLQPLLGEIARMDARINLASQVTETSYPDLELPDIYGRKIRLSSLAGKVVLLDFWSAELGNSNTLNAELKEVYRKYADAPTPLEVYQVAVDTSKPLWITAVQEQQLPWISVSDLRGRASTALGLYNVRKLPANFLIDKNGTIVAKDIYGKSLEKRLDRLTR